MCSNVFFLPTKATTSTPKTTRRALQTICMKTMETRVMARLNSLCLCLFCLPLSIWIFERLLEFHFIIKYLSTLPNFHEDMQIHIDKAYEGEDSSCEGWVPDEREGVPEDEDWVPPGLAWIHFIGSIILSKSYFHELWNVQSKGKSCDRNDID